MFTTVQDNQCGHADHLIGFPSLCHLALCAKSILSQLRMSVSSDNILCSMQGVRVNAINPATVSTNFHLAAGLTSHDPL